MKNLIDVFIEPGKLFAELKEKPTFLLPALLSVGVVVILMLLYFNKVDGDWMFEQQMLASGQEMSAAQMAEAKKFMAGGSMMSIISAVSVVVMTVIIYCIMALYYLIAGKVTGNAVGFKHGLSLTAWSGMPMLLSSIVALIGVLGMQPQTLLDSLFLTHADPLLVQLPIDHAWKGFMTKLDLLSIWSIALIALGWKIWGKTSWLQAIIVALIPNLLIYGTMAAFAMMRS